MQERGVEVDHSTINRWVLKYAPEFDKHIRRRLKPTHDFWRVDETYIKVKGCGNICIEPWILKATP
jgi:transposase, IS6 family